MKQYYIQNKFLIECDNIALKYSIVGLKKPSGWTSILYGPYELYTSVYQNWRPINQFDLDDPFIFCRVL